MPEAKRPLKVFLCHAHSDAEAVRTLYDRLTADGVDAWLDKEKLLPGQDWELEIRKAVRESDVVIVCLSEQFNKAGFKQKEVRWALDTAMEKPEGEIFITPARLEECENLESLRKWHWVDLFEGDGYEDLMRALRKRADNIGASLQVEKKKKPAKRKRNQKSIAVLVALIGLIFVAVFGLPRLFSQPESTPESTLVTTPISKPTTLGPCDPYADNLFNYALNQSSEIASALGKLRW